MKKAEILFIFICQFLLSFCDNKFDFGLFENEPLLKTVAYEDIRINSVLEEYNKVYQDKTLDKFLHTQTRVTTDPHFMEHPLNAYQVIKKYALVYPSMVNKLFSDKLKYKIQTQVNNTEIIQNVSQDDLKRSVSGLVQIIFSYDLDIDDFSKGIIPANIYGNGPADLVSEKPLLADDLYNIGVQAVEYGYLGMAAAVMKAAFKAPRSKVGDKLFEKKLQRMSKNIVELHNGFLDQRRSIYTENYAMKPYLLDANLNKRRKQPTYIKSGRDTLLKISFWHSNT